VDHVQRRPSGSFGERLRGVGREILKIDVPTRHQMVTYSTVVLVTVGTMTLFVFGLDAVFSKALLRLLG
jgi:preprotein translocase SecE subunit